MGAILKADYVLLCTPTKRTPEIIRLIAKEMQRGAYLIEISSQKFKTAQTLLKTPSRVNPVCIHPMFGPGTKSIDGKNIIIIPIKDAKKELDITKLLFPKANFVTRSGAILVHLLLRELFGILSNILLTYTFLVFPE